VLVYLSILIMRSQYEAMAVDRAISSSPDQGDTVGAMSHGARTPEFTRRAFSKLIAAAVLGVTLSGCMVLEYESDQVENMKKVDDLNAHLRGSGLLVQSDYQFGNSSYPYVVQLSDGKNVAFIDLGYSQYAVGTSSVAIITSEKFDTAEECAAYLIKNFSSPKVVEGQKSDVTENKE
jgi:hypothetical protein